MGKRPLNLREIPGALLAEYGLRPGGADSYRCDDPSARPVWIGNVLAPQGRGLNEEVVRSLLSGFIRHGFVTNRLVSHELRHVHQYEAAGSIAAFLPVYLAQIVSVGYEQAPFELDARHHERDAP